MLSILLLACTDPVTPSATDADPAPTSGTVSALTYNVQGLPDALSDAGRPTDERMDRIAPLLEDYDVIGLQEDFDAGHHARLVGAAQHPVSEWFDALVEPGRVYGPGLSVLSRLGTLVAVFEEHYTECNGVFDAASDCLASKGFQVVRLDLGEGAQLDIYNTHHEAGGGDDDDLARASQVQQVLASLDDRSSGRAVVFMGDFNLRWTDPADVDELQAYVDVGLRDACLELDCDIADAIDRFFVRDSDAVRLTVSDWRHVSHFVDEDGDPLSDHPAVALRIDWQR